MQETECNESAATTLQMSSQETRQQLAKKINSFLNPAKPQDWILRSSPDSAAELHIVWKIDPWQPQPAALVTNVTMSDGQTVQTVQSLLSPKIKVDLGWNEMRHFKGSSANAKGSDEGEEVPGSLEEPDFLYRLTQNPKDVSPLEIDLRDEWEIQLGEDGTMWSEDPVFTVTGDRTLLINGKEAADSFPVTLPFHFIIFPGKAETAQSAPDSTESPPFAQDNVRGTESEETSIGAPFEGDDATMHE